MSEMIKLSNDELRDAAIALNEFETSVGAMMLTDALESMLTGKSRPAEELSKVLKESKEGQSVLRKADVKSDGEIKFDWHNAKSAADVRKLGEGKVTEFLQASAKEMGADRESNALMMAKAAKMLDTGATAGAFDRQSLKQLFAPLAIDRQTGKTIGKGDAATIRGAALNAVAKLSGDLKWEIRNWSGTSPLPKRIRRKLIKIWGWKVRIAGVFVPVPVGFPAPIVAEPEPNPPVPNTVLRVNLHRVACLDDTDGGEIGADEIELGGAKSSGMENAPTTGTVAVFGPTSVGQYRTGDSTNYNPLELDSWNLMGVSFPHVFLVNMMMSERDANNRFASVLDELVTQLQQHLPVLISAISVAAGTAIGVGIGTALGSAIAPVIGSIIGAVLGALVGLLTAWISGAVNPEVFENIQERTVVLDTAAHFRDGSTSTPLETLTYVDHGAHYEVVINFTLHQ